MAPSKYRYIEVLPESTFARQRMDSLAFTQQLCEPTSPNGECHCGATKKAGTRGVMLFPEYEQRSDGRGFKFLMWHCALCRCDEHRYGRHGEPSDMLPGCGPLCTRGTLKGVDAPEFPTFEEWVRKHGAAQLRAEGKATVWTCHARPTRTSGRNRSTR